jgi:RNA polymerase sigma-70 factor (ECF subfamily)
MKPSTLTDEQLLAAFARGEGSALAELAGRHERGLLGLAAGLLGGRKDLACDAVQEGWVRVIRFAEKFDGRSSFKTWVYRIVINQCRNILASRPREVLIGTEPETREEASGPERPAEKAETNHALRTAVENLPEDKRMVVLLCYHEGMTHEQAAEILDVPLGTIKSRLHGALEQLRERLSPEVNS